MTNPSEAMEPCPFCNWPATAMMNDGTKVWRVYCNDDGTCGDDAPGCCAEGPEAMTEAEAIRLWNTRAQQAATPAAPVCRYCDGRGIYISKDIANGQEVEIACSYCGETGVAPAAPVQDDDAELLKADAAWLRKRTCNDAINRTYQRIADALERYAIHIAPDRVTPLVEALREADKRLCELTPNFPPDVGPDMRDAEEIEKTGAVVMQLRTALRDGGFDA